MNSSQQDNSTDSRGAGAGDEAMKRAQVRRRIEQYYYQLTEGCGNAGCGNSHCCSNAQVAPLTPNQAAARAVQLLTVSAPLCATLRNKVPRTAAAPEPAPPSPVTSSADVTVQPPPQEAGSADQNVAASTAAAAPTGAEWSADRLISLVETSAASRDYTPVIRAIGHIFSDADTLRRSFLQCSPPASPTEKVESTSSTSSERSDSAAPEELSSDDESPPPDLTSVRRVFGLLFGTGDSPFTAALVTALTSLADSLRAALQFGGGVESKDPRLADVLALVLEVPALGSSEFLDQALPRLCQAAAFLPLPAQVRLIRLWSRYPADRLRPIVQTLQQLISVKVMEAEAAASHRRYQPTDDESVTAPVRLLRLLYYACLLGGRCDPPSARANPADPADQEPARDAEPLERELGVRPIDCRVPVLGFDEFYNEPLSEAVEMDQDYKYYKEYPERFSFMRHPFVLTPATKSLGLYYDSRIRMYHERHMALVHSIMHGAGQPYLRLRVRRDHIVEDALVELEILALEAPEDLKKQLVVQFEGEQGVDEGGVSKEFFQLVVEAIFNPDYGMFTYSEETRSYWFNPTSFENDAQFTLIGVVVGLALYNNVILDIRFPMVVYRKLMGQKGTLEDLAEQNPTLHRSLTSMLEYEGADMEDVFVQSFQVGYTDVFGSQLTHDLKPNGADVMVNRDNVQEFASLYADFLLNASVERQFGAFRRGFLMVTDESPLWQLFRPEEVELLVCGSKDYDFCELEAGTDYDGGFARDSPPVRWFWAIVHDELGDDQRRRLLEFTTGSDRVPVGGLGRLKLIIARNGPDSDRLPTAHTCFNVLLLPEYSSREKLKDMLLKAISYSKGFGML